MHGFEAISAQNGWVMALAGALIVFAGLVVLSTAISQLHRILGLIDKSRTTFEQNQKMPIIEEPNVKLGISLPQQLPSDINEIARLYEPLLEELGETFYLADLYEIARKNDFPHPHITLTAFREAEILISHGDGVFTWNQPKDN